MARKPVIRNGLLPYHICVRANNKEWFYLPTKIVWELFLNNLRELQETRGLLIHLFVLMSNHFHLIASTPNSDIDEVMRWLLRETARHVNARADRINHVFGGPYKWSVIEHAFQYKHAFRYVAQNPIKGGICSQVEDYQFSTLKYQVLSEKLSVEISESCFGRNKNLEKPIWTNLDWLNTPYQVPENDCIRRALRRRVFEFKKDRIHHSIPLALLEDEL